MKQIAIFGGSFNPIHRGHIGVARGVIEQGLADEVWLMVSPCNPLKRETELLDGHIRFEMVRRAVEDMQGLVASDFELSLPLPSYTWRTLRALEETWPHCRFLLLIGADNWSLFSQWAHHEELLRRYSFIVYPRPGFPVAASVLPANVRLLDAPHFPWSATDVRRRLQRGEDVSDMLVPEVSDYIQEKGLYSST